MNFERTGIERKNHHMSQMWYIAGYLPKLRSLGRSEMLAVAAQCSEFSQRDPLHLVTKETYVVKGWESQHKLTGSQVIALLTACVYLLAGDSVEAGEAMFEELPWLKAALLLAEAKEQGLT